VDGGPRRASTALLVMWQGCRTQVAAEQFVAGCSGASWVSGTHFGGVLLGLAMYVVVLELLLVVLSRAEQGMQLSSTDALMMWQIRWTREAS
jgi:hypothetical protein